MAGDLQHIHDPAKAEEFVRALGLQIGGEGHPFVGNWGTKGLYAYSSGQYSGIAYFGTGGSERDRLTMPHESDRYRPWNRYDPDIPANIRKKLIELEDDDSTSIGQPPQPASAQASIEAPSIHNAEGKITLKSVHGKYLSAQPDGRAEWNRDIANEWEYFHMEKRQGGKITLKGAHGMYVSAQSDGNVQINRQAAPPTGWEEFTVEDRGNNVICLKSVHGKYLSAQMDGTAQWNRGSAPKGGWEEFQVAYPGGIVQGGPATNTASMQPSVTVSGAGSTEVNGVYVFKPGKHENRHWNTISGHYQHTQHSEIFIAFQDCGTAHNRPEWNKWMIVSKVGVLYAAHTGGKIGVSPREGGWEMVDSWGNPGAPGGKHPAPTVRHDDQAFKAATKIQEHAPAGRQESIEILEAVAGKPVLFKINNRPSSNDAWVGIYPLLTSDQDHGAQNNRWKWLRDINVNNASFPKQSAGSHSIRVFSDGGHTLHERKDFTVEAKQLDPAAAKSTRKKAWIGLAIGLLLLAPGIPLFIMGLGGGFQYEAVSSGTFEIVDSDGQGDFGFEIFIEGVAGDFDGNGLHNYCENVVITANHTGGWFSTGPHGEILAANPPDESREVFYKEITGEGSGDCASHHNPEQASHNGVQLVKIGRACKDCMNGTTTITAQNVEGGEILMWIRTEENQEKLGMLIPGAIMMGIGALTVIGSLGILAKTRHSHDRRHISGTSSNAGNWFAELSKQSKAIEDQIASGEKLSNHDRVMEEMKFPDKVKVEFDIKQGSSLRKWHSHLFNDPAKSAIIARELGLQVGGAGYDFEGKWRDEGLFAYHTGKYAGNAYFGIGGTTEEEVEQMGGNDKYRPWEVNDPNMPKHVREKWLKIEPILARSYYLYPPKGA